MCLLKLPIFFAADTKTTKIMSMKKATSTRAGISSRHKTKHLGLTIPVGRQALSNLIFLDVYACISATIDVCLFTLQSRHRDVIIKKFHFYDDHHQLAGNLAAKNDWLRLTCFTCARNCPSVCGNALRGHVLFACVWERFERVYLVCPCVGTL